MLRAKNILILLLLSSCEILSAQSQIFTNLADSSVVCQYGYFSNPFLFTGIAPDRHVVVSQQGADPRTGYQLPFLPPGESAVVKLGNEQTGAQAEAITYNFIVDPDSSLLLLKFAVVFEDPHHQFHAQPRFVMRVLNANGQLVDDCAEYDVTASGSIPGFFSFGSQVRWRPWTNVGIDLSDHAGQQIRLQFITYDCAYYGHYGYAYFTASFLNNKLSLNGCDGDEVELVAPSGFDNYMWNNGDTSTLATYTINGDVTANCSITSVTGCIFTLSGTFSTDPSMPTTSSVVYDTICEGENYIGHFFDLPAQWDVGTHTFRNTFFNANNCAGGDITTTLFLTVLPRYTHVYDAVCQGSDYDEYGFHYAELPIGEFTDTIIVANPDGCDSITVLHLTVSPSFNLPNELSGESAVCRNDVYTYTLFHADGLATFHWEVPDGVSILFGQGTATVNLHFTSEAPNPAIITLVGENGCGSGNVSLTVTHFPSYHLFFQDTICTGNEYHCHGFNLARQDSTGWFTFINQYTSEFGCDSTCVLQLLVTGTPTLSILAQPTEICAGQGATIQVFGENDGFIQDVAVPAVVIGDILCTDNSIVKSSEWPVTGKVASGVVFYVDSTGEHGWAVRVSEISNGIAWGGLGTDISALPNYTNARDAVADLEGDLNTQVILSAGNANTYPAVFAVDYASGWYLPAIGQLRILYNSLPKINETLQLVNGYLIPSNSGPWWFNYWWYLSSSEHDASSVWVLGAGGSVSLLNKNTASANYTYTQTIGNSSYTYYYTANTLMRAIRNF